MMSYNLRLFSTIILVQAMMFEATSNQLLDVAVISNDFSTALLLVQLTEDNESSVVMSPLALQTVLSMALIGTGVNSNSHKEIKQFVDYVEDDNSNMLSNFRLLTDLVPNSPTDALTTVKTIYLDKDYDVAKEFLQELKKYFDADLDQLDFKNNPNMAVRKINGQIDRITQGKMKNFMNKGDVTTETKMLLVSCTHFNSKWRSPFNNLKREDFYVNKTHTNKVLMMSQTSYFFYFHDASLNAKILWMPFKDDNLTMIVYLPDKNSRVEDLLWKSVMVGFNFKRNPSIKKRVFIKMPKFTLTTNSDYTSTLQMMGINEIFTPQADFTRIDPYHKISASNVFQKVIVSVDQGDSRAVVASETSFKRCKDETTYEFIADHPFYFSIVKQMPEDEITIPIISGVYRGD